MISVGVGWCWLSCVQFSRLEVLEVPADTSVCTCRDVPSGGTCQQVLGIEKDADHLALGALGTFGAKLAGLDAGPQRCWD
jgi:hypothetical protein